MSFIKPSLEKFRSTKGKKNFKSIVPTYVFVTDATIFCIIWFLLCFVEWHFLNSFINPILFIWIYSFTFFILLFAHDLSKISEIINIFIKRFYAVSEEEYIKYREKESEQILNEYKKSIMRKKGIL